MIYVLLPAYNEEEGIETLLTRLARLQSVLQEKLRIVVVNDGSFDHTIKVVESFRGVLDHHLISFEQNRGVTEVFRAGFAFILKEGKDDDVVVTMDSDNTQNPFVILDIVKKIHEGADIVIGSRFTEHGCMVGAPPLRAGLSLGVAFLVRTIVRLPGVKDYSCFYRGVRLGLLRQAAQHYGDYLIQGHGFSAMARLLILLGNFTDKFAEVPLRLRYDLKEGGSKMKLLKTMQGYLVLLSDHFRGKLDRDSR